ncbi:hypothetical protein QN277_024594 [Acacia crassicarpa]|uniref:RING-type E3 ubiquitin transferase n=1 Tax=Acacia crassicarpa TaxID=499986 RepID=A0AAE1JGA8_9FABA|nr:hypothetical protein QN277_024594 [Acacia crassicarpa]
MTSFYVSISEDLMEDMFDINFIVIQRWVSPNTGCLQITHSEVFPSPFIMPCEELIRDVPIFLHRNVGNYLSENGVGSLASQIISYYQEVINCFTIGSTHHRLIPLIVHLIVDTSYHGSIPLSFHLQTTAVDRDNEYSEHMMDIISDDDESIEIYIDMGLPDQLSSTNEDIESTEINQIIEQQSMQHFFMVPATEKALASLKKMEKFTGNIKTSTCSICLEAFDNQDGEDVLALPCDHFFHNNCIVGWLKTSHTCPLCRFQLPM